MTDLYPAAEAQVYSAAAQHRVADNLPEHPQRERKPAASFLRQLLILSLLSVVLWTVLLACWVAWTQAGTSHGEVSRDKDDFFTNVLLSFGSERYEIRYRDREHHLKLGNLVRLWGVPTVQRCEEATLLTWEAQGIRALLSLPNNPEIGLDAPISLVSFSPLRPPDWVAQVGRCRAASVETW